MEHIDLGQAQFWRFNDKAGAFKSIRLIVVGGGEQESWHIHIGAARQATCDK